jgi:hypothetical protein
MFAQVVEIRLEPARLEIVEVLVRQSLVPALREQSGFCGALNLTDRGRAETLLVLLWETEDEASRPLASRLARIATVPELALPPWSLTVWEVDARG